MSDYTNLMDRLAEASGVFNDNPDAIEHFDDRKFRFGCMLVNQDGYVFRVRKSAIKFLKIVDSLTEWFHYGHVDIENPNDVLERPMGIPTLAEAFNKPITPYRFRNDARDMLYIFMEPYVGDETKGITPKIDNEVYTIKMLFTIHRTEDLNDQQDKSRGKIQRLHFHDYRYQTLIEKNTYYSTGKNLPAETPGGASLVSRIPVTQQNNLHRSKPTGEIIQEIFRSVFMESDISNCFDFNWSFGSNNILYTSPSNFRAIDDVNYLLDRHNTTSGDPCILKLNRYSNTWSFLPLSTYFQRSRDGMAPGILQSERFLLSFDGSVEAAGIPPESKSFTNAGNVMINYHFPDLSVIDDYSFVEMDGQDCQLHLDSTVVTRYSEQNKQFSFDLNQHNISTIRDHFENTYTSALLGTGGSGGTPSWLPDSSRSGYYNFSVIDSWSSDQLASLSASRSRKILSSVMLGNSIYFESRGFTPRRTGVWFTVDRAHQYEENEYDQKVLGQYFATRVEHLIVGATYTNKIIGVKPHLFSAPIRPVNTNDMFGVNTNEVINE